MAGPPGYDWIGRGRKERPEGGEHVLIGYRPGRFNLHEYGTFWLSEQPDEPANVDWDTELPRSATYARFRERATGVSVCGLNTPFDHRGKVARRRSASLLVDWIDDIADGGPAIVMGDMN